MNEHYLLDTQVIQWAVAQPHRLAPSVRDLIEKNRYAVSVASYWELINKKGKAGRSSQRCVGVVGQIYRADKRIHNPDPD